MKSKNLIFTKKDFELMQMVLINWNRDSELTLANYQTLSKELEQATVLDESEIPNTIVRFGSIIDIETPIGLLNGYQIVTPVNRNPKQKKLSVLSAVGSAVIGYSQGDKVKWSFPMGQKTIKIINVNNECLSSITK